MYSFNGFDVKNLTFENCTAVKGYAVKLLSDGRTALADINEKFFGVCVNVRDKNSVVQVSGYIEMPFDGDYINLGYNKLAVGSEGKMTLAQSDVDAREYLVLTHDSVNNTIGFIL